MSSGMKEIFDRLRKENDDLKKRIAELEAENNKARELIDDLIQAALNDCVESIEWAEVEERARAFLINQSEEGKDD